MILWTSNGELAADYSIKVGILMFRTVLRFEFLNNKNYLGFELGTFGEYFSTSSDSWIENHSSSVQKSIILNLRKWSWEECHIYYDGPHCSRSFGWLHFYWCDFNCKKCHSEE